MDRESVVALIKRIMVEEANIPAESISEDSTFPTEDAQRLMISARISWETNSVLVINAPAEVTVGSIADQVMRQVP